MAHLFPFLSVLCILLCHTNHLHVSLTTSITLLLSLPHFLSTDSSIFSILPPIYPAFVFCTYPKPVQSRLSGFVSKPYNLSLKMTCNILIPRKICAYSVYTIVTLKGTPEYLYISAVRVLLFHVSISEMSALLRRLQKQK